MFESALFRTTNLIKRGHIFFLGSQVQPKTPPKDLYQIIKFDIISEVDTKEKKYVEHFALVFYGILQPQPQLLLMSLTSYAPV